MTIASGALGAIGSYQSQQAQAAAANRNSIANYKHQLKVRKNNWMQSLSAWDNDVINYEAEVADNSFAAQQGYADAQLQLNEQFKKAAFAEEASFIKLLQSRGEMAARGVTGNTAKRLDDSVLAEWGRNNAQRTASLVSAKQGFQQNAETIDRQMRSANAQAYDNVAFAPMPDAAPRKPVMERGPSGLGLAMDLIGTGMSAYGQYDALKAPKGFTNLPSAKPSDYAFNLDADWFGRTNRLSGGWT